MTRYLSFSGLVLGVCMACSPDPPPTPDEAVTDGGPLVVYATEYPVAYFAERLVGSLGSVVCPVPEDEDPIHWEPPRDVLEAFRSATLVVTNGAGFARWIENASLPESRLVRTADGFRDDFLRYEDRTHSHGPSGTHSHSGVDPHTWLDPVNARRQAEAVAQDLLTRVPGHRTAIEESLASLHADLEALEAEWAVLGGEIEGVTLLANHPAYDYLLRRFGWAATNLDLDPVTPLTEDQVAQLRGLIEEGRRTVMLWEAVPLPAISALLRDELDIACVVVPPSEVLSAKDRESGEDYLSLQRAAISRLRATLESANPETR